MIFFLRASEGNNQASPYIFCVCIEVSAQARWLQSSDHALRLAGMRPQHAQLPDEYNYDGILNDYDDDDSDTENEVYAAIMKHRKETYLPCEICLKSTPLANLVLYHSCAQYFDTFRFIPQAQELGWGCMIFYNDNTFRKIVTAVTSCSTCSDIAGLFKGSDE